MKRISHFIFALFLIVFSCTHSNPEKEVKQVIQQFGEQLKQVSVLAPDSLFSMQLKKVYKPYVMQPLLQSWLTNPSTAPGRRTSSPWPEKIDIVQLVKINDGLFRAEAEVVYITSAEKVNGGKALTQKVIIEVVKGKEGEWRISKYSTYD